VVEYLVSPFDPKQGFDQAFQIENVVLQMIRITKDLTCHNGHLVGGAADRDGHVDGVAGPTHCFFVRSIKQDNRLKVGVEG
jgi:hypothetical protein